MWQDWYDRTLLRNYLARAVQNPPVGALVRGGEELRLHCPICQYHRPTLYYNLKYGLVNCFHRGCPVRGRISLSYNPIIQKKIKYKHESLKAWINRIRDNRHDLSKKSLRYLYKRTKSKEILKTIYLRTFEVPGYVVSKRLYEPDQVLIVFDLECMFTKSKVLLVHNFEQPERPKYLTIGYDYILLCFGLDRHCVLSHRDKNYLFATEGIFDMMAFFVDGDFTAGFAGSLTSLFNVVPKYEKRKYVLKNSQIVLVPDKDFMDHLDVNSLKRYLAKCRATPLLYISHMPYKDFGEVLKIHGPLTKKQQQTIIEGSKPFHEITLLDGLLQKLETPYQDIKEGHCDETY